jgi:hypothetical protein
VTDPAGGWDTGEYERLAAVAVAAVARHVAESQAGEKAEWGSGLSLTPI